MGAADDDRLTGSPSFQTDLAAAWSSDAMTRSFSATATGSPAELPFLFSAGQGFGPYLIVRQLGKGGMGQVYEAEERDSGRRVAIKILSRGIGDEEDRERFLAEGRLAAALSHPNSVYIFGTSEVQGLPVIAMELAPGGTLKDLVAGKTLSPAEAVDATLQVVAGLQAAAAIGILHRDVKPSNCFIDSTGRVVVGDFGLSLATDARGGGSTEGTGSIQGTPGYASPEQLRGEALDVRADIYSVGATLFYLLAARPPFEDPDFRRLIERVRTESAPLVTSIRPDLPRGLANVVARCLAKTPSERFADYAALAAALEPFRSVARTPATLGRRILAGILDNYAASLCAAPINLYFGIRLINPDYRYAAILLSTLAIAAEIAYYTLGEGFFGAAVGKAVFRLRVATPSPGAPGVRAALVRACIFLLPGHVLKQAATFLLVSEVWRAATGRTTTVSLAFIGSIAPALATIVTIALFSTARRRNGWAGLHDRFSGTSVVLEPRSLEVRETAATASATRPPAAVAARRLGPYSVAATADRAVAGTIEGFDDRLQRPVWIEIMPQGSAPLPALRRDLSRPARARWLTGRRADGECWDAYEAIDGQPFNAIVARPQPWSRVRHWVAELAEEIAAGLGDGTLPALSTSRLWVAADDRARLLEWVPPGVAVGGSAAAAGTAAPDFPAAQRFLYVAMLSALLGRTASGADLPALPLPVPARTLLLSLRGASFGTPEAMAAEAASMLRTPAILTRSRRAAQLAACAAFPAFVAISIAAGVLLMQRMTGMDNPAMRLSMCLDRLAELTKLDKRKGVTPDTEAERRALETYVATDLRATVENPETWLKSFPSLGVKPGHRDAAQRALDTYRDASPDERRAAAAVATAMFASERKELASVQATGAIGRIIAVSLAATAAFVGCLGLVGAFAARGGFTLRLFGAAVVRRDGREVSRLRTLARGAIAWSPAAIMPIAHVMGLPVSMDSPFGAVPSLVGVLVLTAGAVWALTHPTRGLQDRFMGTWLVPR